MDVDLYPRVLGPAWDQLAEEVRQLHRQGADVHAAGQMCVTHGGNVVARCLVRLFRMPRAGAAVPTRLTITREQSGERWLRTFNGRPMVTTQWPRDEGLLAEYFRGLDVRFQLSVEEGALVYCQRQVFARLGPLRLPLPQWLAPHVAAREEAAGAASTHITVRVVLPLLGPLITYEGTMTIVPAEAN